MKVTLHQLNTLEAVKTHGSITAAAHALHITQPAVSNILKQLEQLYSHKVTETIGKKIFLTEAGEKLVETAKHINLLLDNAVSDINAMHGELSGTLTVAIVSTAKYFVPKLLGEFRSQHPKVKIKLTVCNRQEAIKILKNNSSDFLIMSQLPDGIPIRQQLFYQDKLVVATSPGLEIKPKPKQLRDLNNYDWIIREPGSGTRIVMKKLFKQYKMLPNLTMEVSNNESIKQLIMANMGISIISKQSAELELKNKLIKILPIENFPIEHSWYLVMNKGKHINHVMHEFFDFVKQHKGYF